MYYESLLGRLHHSRPLIHCINNIVTAHDCANLLLAVGASPMMAQAPQEMSEISKISDVTVINTGTPDESKFQACYNCAVSVSGKHPIIFDPVGIGASSWRLQWAQKLLKEFTPFILRVNLGEARALLHLNGGAQGVDSPDQIPSEIRKNTAIKLAQLLGCTVLLSAPEDIITDGKRCRIVPGGSDLMAYVTGTGCMLSVLCGAFSAVEADSYLAALGASFFWKDCAKEAEIIAGEKGLGSFHTALFDVASIKWRDNK